MNHDAVYKLHSNVSYIVEDEANNTWTAYDTSDNVVTFTDAELTAISNKETELNNEIKLDELRYYRNKKLAETDHWGLSDTAAMTQAQTDYRQALRDITDTYSDLDTVVWPTKP